MQNTSEIKAKMLDQIKPNWVKLLDFNLDEIIQQLPKNITPPLEKVFEFARLTAFNNIKVVIVGQDPYPRAGDAHGLAFSCLTGIPGSLLNIYKCLLCSKLINEIPIHGNLEYWARQGVLLLNRSLTTEVGQSNVHADLWDKYTIKLIKTISRTKPVIFMLWGNNAKEFIPYINKQCVIYTWCHPSPLAQARAADDAKFIKCPHFKDANKHLASLNLDPIDWHVDKQLSEIEQAFDNSGRTQVVFTDGSCNPNRACKQALGGYAASFALGTMKDIILYGNIENDVEYATNQRAEGIAILKVLEYLDQHLDEWSKCIIVSDSDFWIKMFEVYMPSWYEHNKFDEKKNPDLTKPMWELYGKLQNLQKTIQFRHMKSHGKDGWQKFPEGSYENFCYVNNQYVDELAGYARKELSRGVHVVSNAVYE